MIQVSSYTKTAKRAGKSSFIAQFKAQYIESDMDLDLSQKVVRLQINIYTYIYISVNVFSPISLCLNHKWTSESSMF